ncbi:MAG TPA: hypothetical protein VJ743_14125 [Albitalea sp.]|nr:hypothetical protein [Albitalea sp.]
MTATVPFKTPLGHEELRARTHKLGQRHRTILFLIDGRRPLAEVLSLAQQAGAATQHFEDLLRLGMVELPPAPSTSAPVPLQPEVSDEGALTSVELIVPDDEEAVQTLHAPLVTEVVEPLPAPPLERPPAPPVEAPPVAAPVPPPAQSMPAEAEPPRPAKRKPGAIPAAPRMPAPPTLPVLSETVAAPAEAALLTPPASPPREPAVPAMPATAPASKPLDIDLPLPDQAEARLLQEVRQLLIDTLGIDAPLFSARTFVRVRNAQSVSELIDLVWEIQEHVSRKRRSRRELQGLQRARELLGLGNTLVDEDSRVDYRDE